MSCHNESVLEQRQFLQRLGMMLTLSCMHDPPWFPVYKLPLHPVLHLH